MGVKKIWLTDLFICCQQWFHVVIPFAVRGCRPGKTVQMSENEIRALCHKSREIFLSQPILLELEAPLKICGKFRNVPNLFCYFREV